MTSDENYINLHTIASSNIFTHPSLLLRFATSKGVCLFCK